MKSETYLIGINSEKNLQVFNSLQLKFGEWFRPNFLQIIEKVYLVINHHKSKLIREKNLAQYDDNATKNPDQRLFL